MQYKLQVCNDYVLYDIYYYKNNVFQISQIIFLCSQLKGNKNNEIGIEKGKMFLFEQKNKNCIS